MADLKYADRVAESTISTGAGDVFLAGPIDLDHDSFADQFADGDEMPVVVFGGGKWLTFRGRYNSGANSLTRVAFRRSSTGSNLSLSGTMTVMCGWGAEDAIISQAAVPPPLVLPKTANHTVITGDRGKLLSFSVAQGSTATAALPAAATVGDGWSFHIDSTNYGAVILDPNGSETIDGASTLNVYKGQSFQVVSDGANWRTVGRQGRFTIEARRNLSAQSSINFTIPDGLTNMELDFSGLFSSSSGDNLLLRSSADGTTFDAGASDYVAGRIFLGSSSTVSGGSNTSQNGILIAEGIFSSAGGYNPVGVIKIVNTTSFSAHSSLSAYNIAAAFHEIQICGGYRNAGTMKAFQLKAVTGNISLTSGILTGIA